MGCNGVQACGGGAGASDGQALAVDGVEAVRLGLPALFLYWKGGATRGRHVMQPATVRECTRAGSSE